MSHVTSTPIGFPEVSNYTANRREMEDRKSVPYTALHTIITTGVRT
jgi:hypothetical protein